MTTETQTDGTSAPDTSAATASDTGTATGAPDAAAAPASTAATDTILTAGDTAAPEATDTQAEAGDAKADDAPQGAPESYADFAAPEGVTLDTEALGEFTELAKAKNLTQEDAQAFVDLGAKITQKVEAKYVAQIEQARAQWAKDSAGDKEFGGDNFKQNAAVAKNALETFGSPALTDMLRESGLGNHPEIIRAFYRVGLAIGEDKLVPGRTKPHAVANAQTLFDKSGMNP